MYQNDPQEAFSSYEKWCPKPVKIMKMAWQQNGQPLDFSFVLFEWL